MLDPGIIVPGHGPVTDPDGVRGVKAYWEYLGRHVRTRHEQGLSPRRAAYDIVFETDFLSKPFAQWNSPERIMTNTHILYRHLRGKSGHLKLPELIAVLWQQAQLAHDLPQAQPAVMRKTAQANTP